MTAHSAGRVTIADIAREAGVSLPTVSRVLNGRSDVSATTRRRVEELLAHHGYRRRTAHPASRAGLIDLVFNDLDSPWAVEILRGVEEAAHAAGLGTVVSAVHRQEESARQWLVNLRSRTSDGVILVTSELAPELHAELRRLGVPVVVVDPAGVPTFDIPTIGAMNWAGGRSAVEHLVSLGHRRIGIVAGPPTLLCSRARLDGYRAALESAGIGVDEELCRTGDFSHESGFTCGAALLDLAEQHAVGHIRRREVRAFLDQHVVAVDHRLQVAAESGHVEVFPLLVGAREDVALAGDDLLERFLGHRLRAGRRLGGGQRRHHEQARDEQAEGMKFLHAATTCSSTERSRVCVVSYAG